MSLAWARTGGRAVWPRPAAARSSTRLQMTSPGTIQRRARSTTWGTEGATKRQDELWKSVFRAFLLHVHPDFFQDSPKERAVNEKSLKKFSQHLERLQQQQHNTNNLNAVDTSPLVFFLKQEADDAGIVDYEGEDAGKTTLHNNADLNHTNTDGNDGGGSSLRKFIMPLESHHKMATILHEAGIITSASVPPPRPLPSSGRQTDQTVTKRKKNGQNNAQDGSGDYGDSGWHRWGDDLFRGAPADRARGGMANGRGASRPGGRSAFSGVDDTSREGRQRTTEWGAAFEKSSGDASRLGIILASDAGRALVRERRASSQRARQLVVELQEQFGFGEFTFRCGWSKANLCVALASLLETCHTHRGMLNVPDFGGLEVVFRNDPSVLHKAEIRLCPADVPNQWVSVLRCVTPAVLSSSRETTRELLSLEEKASDVLRGARLSRGLSCSKSRYVDFLRRLCAAGAADTDAGGDGDGRGVALGDWSALRCKVEEGFSRTSKVLEDGSIQIGSDMTLGTLRRCLGRDFASSCAVTAEAGRLEVAAAATAHRCRRSLGLAAIERARHAVSLSQMIVACEALAEFSEGVADEAGGKVKDEDCVAARRRLRGHCVMVVGSRVGVSDGLTEDGEITIPWNWAVAGNDGEDGSRSSASPFF